VRRSRPPCERTIARTREEARSATLLKYSIFLNTTRFFRLGDFCRDEKKIILLCSFPISQPDSLAACDWSRAP
jgi:hypothetical protein